MNFRFHHIHLVCSDLEQTIDFFRGVLGATLTARKPFGDADGAALDLSGTLVNLRIAAPGESVAPRPSATTYGYHHLCLEVDNVDAAFADLTQKGVAFVAPPKAIPGSLRIAFFKGPDDILIELLQRC